MEIRNLKNNRKWLLCLRPVVHCGQKQNSITVYAYNISLGISFQQSIM